MATLGYKCNTTVQRSGAWLAQIEVHVTLDATFRWGGRRGDSRAGQGFSGAPRIVARSRDRTMVRCMEREGPEHTVLFLDESTVRMDDR